MLEKVNNPLTEFTSAISADVLNFVGKTSISEFKEVAHQLNSMENYPITQIRANNIGLVLQSCDFSGYEVSASIQGLLDKEIHASISTRIQSQTDEREQASLDYSLQKEMERQEKELELKSRKFENELSQVKSQEAAASEQRLVEVTREYAAKLKYLAQLKKLDVDITKVLVAENQKTVSYSMYPPHVTPESTKE